MSLLKVTGAITAARAPAQLKPIANRPAANTLKTNNAFRITERARYKLTHSLGHEAEEYETQTHA